jgi:hypothetical protein
LGKLNAEALANVWLMTGMSDRRSIFFDEWRACLRAHYVYVLRTNDTVTEPTLRHVLRQTGISEEELAALQAEALGAPLPPPDLPPAPDPAPPAPPAPDSFEETEAVAEDLPEEPPSVAPGQLPLF